MLASDRPDTARGYALLAGGLLAGLTVALRHFVFAPYGTAGSNALVELWILTGAVALGAAPAYVLVQYRIATPLAITIGLYASVVFATYVRVGHANPGSARLQPAPLLLELYVWVWFVPLAAALAVGAAEYGLQHLCRRLSIDAETGS